MSFSNLFVIGHQIDDIEQSGRHPPSPLVVELFKSLITANETIFVFFKIAAVGTELSIQSLDTSIIHQQIVTSSLQIYTITLTGTAIMPWRRTICKEKKSPLDML